MRELPKIGQYVKIMFSDRPWGAPGGILNVKVLSVGKASFTFTYKEQTQIRPLEIILQVYIKEKHPEMFL